mmetsp:Transcript_12360/g.16042  ORF Transcript_12360/g.16042 Transcript_12360/m.16042 type:complete len:80 (-) Transcript_12360:139-378(-)
MIYSFTLKNYLYMCSKNNARTKTENIKGKMFYGKPSKSCRESGGLHKKWVFHPQTQTLAALNNSDAHRALSRVCAKVYL